MSEIVIHDLREAGEDGGDLMGFFARGHHDRYLFAEAANKFNGADSPYDRRHVTPDRNCYHAWWRTTPMSGQPGCSLFTTAEPKSPGAYPVTVWDGLASHEMENDKRAIREHHRGRCNGLAEGVNWALRYLENRAPELATDMLAAFRETRDRMEGEPL